MLLREGNAPAILADRASLADHRFRCTRIVQYGVAKIALVNVLVEAVVRIFNRVVRDTTLRKDGDVRFRALAISVLRLPVTGLYLISTLLQACVTPVLIYRLNVMRARAIAVIAICVVLAQSLAMRNRYIVIAQRRRLRARARRLQFIFNFLIRLRQLTCSRLANDNRYVNRNRFDLREQRLMGDGRALITVNLTPLRIG